MMPLHARHDAHRSVQARHRAAVAAARRGLAATVPRRHFPAPTRTTALPVGLDLRDAAQGAGRQPRKSEVAVLMMRAVDASRQADIAADAIS